MGDILVDERDQKFVLFEQFEVGKFSESKIYSEFDADTYSMILEQANKLATNAMMPTNSESDTEGCHLTDGNVSVPKPFRELWRIWNEGGWRGLDLPQEMGGQGMPMVIGMAANEYFEAGNLAFQTLAAMTRGAALLIATHGNEEQKKKYVDKIMAGIWTGTMVLTEANAGSDVGASTTTAEKNSDGTYSIKGSKVFITGGDTDLSENIVHLTLARIKGAPAGTKGLSLFLVPKIKINTDGSLGTPNDVKVVAIEKKLGLKGSPTCQLSFGDDGNCIGELIGKENQGMVIFFTMMNESRLIAARHGAAVASTAYLNAVAYAKERLQGTEIGAPKGAGQCPIIKHPDVKRMLLQMKAYTEGVRTLILYVSYCIDRERMAQTKEELEEWDRRTSFLTPVAKAYGTDLSFRVTETAMQVYGGYGYTKDYPIEQFLRDEKVHSIFEGANGIHAFELVKRKLIPDFDTLFKGHLNDIKIFCDKNKGHKVLGRYVEILNIAGNELSEISKYLYEAQKKDFLPVALYAYQYLELFGDVTVGWLLLWKAVIAQNKLAALAEEKKIKPDEIKKFTDENPNAAFYASKLSTARYFASNILILAGAKAQAIKAMDTAALEIAEDAF